MEEQIKKTNADLQKAYGIFWGAICLLFVCGESISSLEGIWAEQVRVVFFLETAAILLTALCVPLSLKLFAWALQHKMADRPLAEALLLYKRWSLIRLSLLWLPALVGLTTYYCCLSTTGLLCTCIAAIASLLCVPGETKMRSELQAED